MGFNIYDSLSYRKKKNKLFKLNKLRSQIMANKNLTLSQKIEEIERLQKEVSKI